jgi:hypothetical protein
MLQTDVQIHDSKNNNFIYKKRLSKDIPFLYTILDWLSVNRFVFRSLQ